MCKAIHACRPWLKGASQVFDLIPNNESRLKKIRPDSSDISVLRRDANRVWKDFSVVVLRRSG